MDIKKYIKTFDRYFKQNTINSAKNVCFFDIQETLFKRSEELPSNVNIIVTIPCYDDPEIFKALDSLEKNTTSKANACVFVLVNFSEDEPSDVKQRNIELYNSLLDYASTSRLFVKVFSAFDLPIKLSGVGVARKLLMDAAAYYYYINKRAHGIITSTDADTLFESNYLDALIRILGDVRVSGLSINFEHRIDEVKGRYRDAIVKYELYMRYYRMALLWCGHPYYYSCIGSAIATNAIDYVAQGGMSKKKAGEDFYFIQKLITTNRFTETSDTKVFPSARLSNRTPFGTGRAIKEIAEDGGEYLVFSPSAFAILKDFFEKIVILCRDISKVTNKVLDDKLYLLVELLYSNLHPYLRECISLSELNKIILDAYANTSSEKKLIQRFFYNFNALKVLQCLNLMHKENIERIDIFDALNSFLVNLGYSCKDNIYDMLLYLRENDRII